MDKSQTVRRTCSSWTGYNPGAESRRASRNPPDSQFFVIRVRPPRAHRCSVENCPKSAVRATETCIAHGGGLRCQHVGDGDASCDKSAQVRARLRMPPLRRTRPRRHQGVNNSYVLVIKTGWEQLRPKPTWKAEF
jgi:hypothetical protein